MPNRKVIDTYPQYVVDDIPLTDTQCDEYDELLMDSAGNTDIADDAWRLGNFNDGDQWYSLMTVNSLERRAGYMSELDADDLPDVE